MLENKNPFILMAYVINMIPATATPITDAQKTAMGGGLRPTADPCN